MEIAIVVAADEHNGIGFENKLLCHLPNDLKYFKSVTNGGTILMGRKTYASIGKPLPNRSNYVLSNSVAEIEGCKVFPTLQDAIANAQNNQVQKIFIIGGATIYKQVMPYAHELYFTRIHHIFQADAFFPEIPPSEWKLVRTEPQMPDEKNAFAHTFEVYQRINTPQSF